MRVLIIRIKLLPLIPNACSKLSQLLDKIFHIANRVLIKFGYRVLKVKAVDCNLDIYIQKIRSPQLSAIIIELLQALSRLLPYFPFLILGIQLINAYTKKVEENIERTELIKKVAESKLPESQKLLIFKLLQQEQKEQPTASQIITAVNAIVSLILIGFLVYFIIKFVFPLLRGVAL